jgi:hypothetical protein
MEKCVIKLVVFNSEDFGYWKNQTRNYLLSQCRAIWDIGHEVHVIPATLDNAAHGRMVECGVVQTNGRMGSGSNVTHGRIRLATIFNAW